MRKNDAKNRKDMRSRIGGRRSAPGRNRAMEHIVRARTASRNGRAASDLSCACRVAAVFLMAAILILPVSSASLPAAAPAGSLSPTPAHTPSPTNGPTPIPKPDPMPVPWADNFMPPVEDEIYMTWAYRPNTLSQVPSGVNVLAPVWFYVERNAQGVPEVHAPDELNEDPRPGWDPEQYVAAAHEGGAQVWAVAALLGDADLAKEFLRNPDYIEAFIARCNEWIGQYGLDGISFDFEYMDSADIDAYTAFVGACKQGFPPGTVVSAAVNYKLAGDQSNNWWQSYDPGGLAKVCDYIAVMTYSGYQKDQMNPVAPIGWLREEIEEMLLEVPSNQLLMGIPFYGADYQSQVIDGNVFKVQPLWAESSDYRATITQGTIERALTVGEFTIKGDVHTVDYWINRGQWDPDLGITTWSFVDKSGIMHTLWCEDENSLYQKGMLAREYHLAGVAVWQMSQGREAMWQSLARGLTGQ